MTTPPAPHPIALIGGMGPEAGADALGRFLAACRGEMHRAGLEISDQAYPPHVLVQFPIPDRSQALLRGGASPLPGMVDAFCAARASGARVFGIACNTAHFWHRELSLLFPGSEIVHIADATAQAVKRSGARTCAVMATMATQQGGLYQEALGAHGLQAVDQDSDELHAVHEAIFAIKAGRTTEARDVLEDQLERLLDRADAVVLGCTELGLVLRPAHYPPGRVVDAADVLAATLASRAYSASLPLHRPASTELQ